MIFNSVQYALFLPMAVIVYILLPQKVRWLFLLVASYFFYMCWDARYAVLLLTSTAVTFFAANLMKKSDSRRQRVFYLISGLAVNLGILFIFKYFNFFIETAAGIAGLFGADYKPVELKLLLPIGISFYTFQSLGYMLDVYMDKTKAMSHFGKYALFVSFFPQLAAGPIGRIDSLRPQFDLCSRPTLENIRSGLLLIGQGLFKKLVIADRLGVLVNTVYDSPADHYGMHFAAATVFFAVQIYCDFSGYSDIAIGSARLLGIELMENFKRPYLATTVSEFWKRWHISLTSWFRDYIYIPLGGNRRRHLFNIMVVFFVSGLWHGASLTFIVWGLLNGLYQVLGIILRPYSGKLKERLGVKDSSAIYRAFKMLWCFALISFSWIFFRANSIGDIKLILSRLFTFNASFLTGFNTASLGMDRTDLVVSALLIIILFIYELAMEKEKIGKSFRNSPLVLRWAFYLIVIAIIIVFGVYGDANGAQFIYFQF